MGLSTIARRVRPVVRPRPPPLQPAHPPRVCRVALADGQRAKRNRPYEKWVEEWRKDLDHRKDLVDKEAAAVGGELPPVPGTGGEASTPPPLERPFLEETPPKVAPSTPPRRPQQYVCYFVAGFAAAAGAGRKRARSPACSVSFQKPL